MPRPAALVRRLSYRSALALDLLVDAFAEDADPTDYLSEVGVGDAGNRRLLDLGLAVRNPCYAAMSEDCRHIMPTALGREVLELAKADRLRFRASGTIVSRGEFGKPTDPMTLALRDGREPTEDECRAYFDAMFAEAGI
jgi:hypothetical protein